MSKSGILLGFCLGICCCGVIYLLLNHTNVSTTMTESSEDEGKIISSDEYDPQLKELELKLNELIKNVADVDAASVRITYVENSSNVQASVFLAGRNFENNKDAIISILKENVPNLDFQNLYILDQDGNYIYRPN